MEILWFIYKKLEFLSAKLSKRPLIHYEFSYWPKFEKRLDFFSVD